MLTDPPADVLDQIESGLVGPLRVLDHDHRWTVGPCEEVQHRPEHSGTVVGFQCCEQLRVGGGDLPQRSERVGRQQIVAASPAQSGTDRVRVGEVTDQARLADARLTPDHHHTPRALAGTPH